MTVNRDEFLSDLETYAHSRFAAFDQFELLAFVEAAWPLIANRPGGPFPLPVPPCQPTISGACSG